MQGDGIPDLVVGVPNDDDGGTRIHKTNKNWGALWIVALRADGTIKRLAKTSSLTEGLDGQGYIRRDSLFGSSISNMVSGTYGQLDVAVGSPTVFGQVLMMSIQVSWPVAAFCPEVPGMYLAVSSVSKLSGLEGSTLDQAAEALGLSQPLYKNDNFGCALSSLGDIDDDAVEDIAVGACKTDTDGTSSLRTFDQGAVCNKPQRSNQSQHTPC